MVGELIGAIIFYLVLRLIFKILNGIYSSLFDSNSNEETSNHDDGAIDSNSNNNQEPVIENTSNPIEDSEPVVEEKEPELKYKNAVYISFRRKVYKAFEAYKRAGENVVWDLEADGFSYPIGSSMSEGREVYQVMVRRDNDNSFGLADPYYIRIVYSVAFKKDDLDHYIEVANYLNDYYHLTLDKSNIFHEVRFSESMQLGVYFCSILATDNKVLYELTKQHGEPKLFAMLLKRAEQLYTEGLELYKNRHK